MSRMLAAVDPESGEKLDDENMIFQMVTFLIAGHETTSATLSFAIEFLLHNPDVLKQAREVVDSVLGTETPRFEHLQHLKYIEQILMETLRLWPPAPAFTVRANKDTLLAGKYEVTSREDIIILIPSLHRDPKVWGDAPDKFDPDRFATEQAEKLPPNAWKPFGNCARACIGRPFAMQEAQLVLSMLLQRFDF
ncbi:cytochrome P450 [Paraglaciecola sp. 20A4]|uniref:cytochrome P450 n=1 Tax=Paraglaciecola sp. 20A4 TaxID=2687288 RepID=UPI0023F7D24C|nr:cytochrome P450 [Paraglaciecola sp. 20A4]